MSGMVQVAVAGDVAEAELETAQDAIEALTEPDELISE